MLLRVGVIMVLSSLVLAAGVAAVVLLRGESPTTALSPAEQQAVETPEKKREFDPGKKLEIEDEPRQEKAKPAPQERPKSKSRPEPYSAAVDNWPRPTNEEVASADVPRYFGWDSGAVMTLTVEALGLYDVPVISSDSLQALDTSLMHVPETSLPWDSSPHRNVYISGHYLGWPGTASRLVFYNLDKLQNGDEVILEDAGGNIYRYQVSESFSAWPDDSWVMGQEVGRDMVTLQTCIPPTFAERLVVRADRV
jgi:sortase A